MIQRPVIAQQIRFGVALSQKVQSKWCVCHAVFFPSPKASDKTLSILRHSLSAGFVPIQPLGSHFLVVVCQLNLSILKDSGIESIHVQELGAGGDEEFVATEPPLEGNQKSFHVAVGDAAYHAQFVRAVQNQQRAGVSCIKGFDIREIKVLQKNLFRIPDSLEFQFPEPDADELSALQDLLRGFRVVLIMPAQPGSKGLSDVWFEAIFS